MTFESMGRPFVSVAWGGAGIVGNFAEAIGVSSRKKADAVAFDHATPFLNPACLGTQPQIKAERHADQALQLRRAGSPDPLRSQHSQPRDGRLEAQNAILIIAIHACRTGARG